MNSFFMNLKLLYHPFLKLNIKNKFIFREYSRGKSGINLHGNLKEKKLCEKYDRQARTDEKTLKIQGLWLLKSYCEGAVYVDE